MVWVMVGIMGCVLRPTRHSLVTLFSLSLSVKDRPLHWTLGKSQTYYPKHILGYGRREDLSLSCRGFWLFSDQLIGGGDGGGLSTALSLGLRSGGLGSKFGRGPRHPGQEGDGLVLLVLGVQAGRVFSGYLAGHIDQRIARQSGMACLQSSTVVRTKR